MMIAVRAMFSYHSAMLVLLARAYSGDDSLPSRARTYMRTARLAVNFGSIDEGALLFLFSYI